jgi:methyl-accepting chemotaxis protein
LQSTHNVNDKIGELLNLSRTLDDFVSEQKQASQNLTNVIESIAESSNDVSDNVSQAVLGIQEISSSASTSEEISKHSVENLNTLNGSLQQILISCEETNTSVNKVENSTLVIQNAVTDIYSKVHKNQENAKDLNQLSKQLDQSVSFFQI